MTQDILSPFFSIIIPIRNGEKYIKRCIDSILIQTFTNYEVLLCENNSSDNSFEVCLDYENKDARFHAFHLGTAGVFHARNHGIEKSKGVYIVFIDVDDYLIKENSLEIIFNTLVDNKYPEILSMSILLDGLRHEIFYASKTTSIVDGPTAILYMHQNKESALLFCGGKVFCRNLIEHIRFDESLSSAEDTLFNVQCMLKSKRIVLLSDILYMYVIHIGSTTIQSEEIELAHLNKVGDDLIKAKYKIYECCNFDKNLALHTFAYYLHSLRNTTLEAYRKGNKEYLNKYIDLFGREIKRFFAMGGFSKKYLISLCSYWYIKAHLPKFIINSVINIKYKNK